MYRLYNIKRSPSSLAYRQLRTTLSTAVPHSRRAFHNIPVAAHDAVKYLQSVCDQFSIARVIILRPFFKSRALWKKGTCLLPGYLQNYFPFIDVFWATPKIRELKLFGKGLRHQTFWSKDNISDNILDMSWQWRSSLSSHRARWEYCPRMINFAMLH